MSWLYRPTPVVAMGRGAFASQNVAPGLNGGTMRGILHGWNYAPGLGKAKAAKTGRQPWIKSSGTMGDFIPNGLGGLGDDIATSDAPLPDSLTSPDFAPIDTSGFYNPGNLIATPQFQVTDSILPSSLTVPSGAGPSGFGIPGTQPLNAASLISPVASIFSSVAKSFTPSTPKAIAATNYAALPGYGGAQPPTGVLAWLNKPTTLPGLTGSTNAGVLLLGTAVALLVVAVGIGGKRR